MRYAASYRDRHPMIFPNDAGKDSPYHTGVQGARTHIGSHEHLPSLVALSSCYSILTLQRPPVSCAGTSGSSAQKQSDQYSTLMSAETGGS